MSSYFVLLLLVQGIVGEEKLVTIVIFLNFLLNVVFFGGNRLKMKYFVCVAYFSSEMYKYRREADEIKSNRGTVYSCLVATAQPQDVE